MERMEEVDRICPGVCDSLSVACPVAYYVLYFVDSGLLWRAGLGKTSLPSPLRIRLCTSRRRWRAIEHHCLPLLVMFEERSAAFLLGDRAFIRSSGVFVSLLFSS
jgi:hypothetical protein